LPVIPGADEGNENKNDDGDGDDGGVL